MSSERVSTNMLTINEIGTNNIFVTKDDLQLNWEEYEDILISSIYSWQNEYEIYLQQKLSDGGEIIEKCHDDIVSFEEFKENTMCRSWDSFVNKRIPYLQCKENWKKIVQCDGINITTFVDWKEAMMIEICRDVVKRRNFSDWNNIRKKSIYKLQKYDEYKNSFKTHGSLIYTTFANWDQDYYAYIVLKRELHLIEMSKQNWEKYDMKKLDIRSEQIENHFCVSSRDALDIIEFMKSKGIKKYTIEIKD